MVFHLSLEDLNKHSLLISENPLKCVRAHKTHVEEVTKMGVRHRKQE